MSIDDLRRQLRERGYLSHGIERWFALDPWSSRAFWLELATVAAKAATLLAAFGALPFVTIMLFRNGPLSLIEVLLLIVLYGTASLVAAFAFIIAVALILKLRPAVAIDTPRALLGISIGAAAALTAPVAIWWYRFESPPSLIELVIGLGLIVLFFLMATVIVSAALLSFSIYELHRVPAIHQKPRTVPMTIAAAVLMALLFVLAYAAQERRTPELPVQVVTTPTTRRVAFIGVDGLTHEIFATRAAGFASVASIPPLEGGSAAERWASIGTGTPTRAHGVRSIEAVKFRGGTHLIQTLSRGDFVIHLFGLTKRQPLPPTVRRRDYVWEIFAARGIPAASVNWWTTETARAGGLDSVGQETIFAAATQNATAADAAIRVDEAAARTVLQRDAQFVTVYLPALDVVLNRLPLDRTAQLAASVRALDALSAVIAQLRSRGYEVVLTGLPGENQSGRGVIASTLPLQNQPASPYDAAPTLCTLLGFPASAEMPGRSLLPTPDPQRVATYGNRTTAASSTRVDEEYYENLRSLGYVR